MLNAGYHHLMNTTPGFLSHLVIDGVDGGGKTVNFQSGCQMGN